jgi:hypothetical protein
MLDDEILLSTKSLDRLKVSDYDKELITGSDLTTTKQIPGNLARMYWGLFQLRVTILNKWARILQGKWSKIDCQKNSPTFFFKMFFSKWF